MLVADNIAVNFLSLSKYLGAIASINSKL